MSTIRPVSRRKDRVAKVNYYLSTIHHMTSVPGRYGGHVSVDMGMERLFLLGHSELRQV